MNIATLTSLPVVFEGPLYRAHPDEDGESAITFDLFIGIELHGIRWVHSRSFSELRRTDAEAFAERIARRGRVDLRHWDENWTPYEPLTGCDNGDHVEALVGLTLGCLRCGTTLDAAA